MGYGLTILNLEGALITLGHIIFGGLFASLFMLHTIVSVVLIRYNWRKTFQNIVDRSASYLTWLRFFQRVSGWILAATALLVIFSGIDWFKIGTGRFIPFSSHIRWEAFLSVMIIVHTSIGANFALLRRRIRRSRLETVDTVSLSRRNAITVLSGMFLSLIAASYLGAITRITKTISDITGILPPGQYEVDKLRVLHVGFIPEFEEKTWTLEVYGKVRNPFTLNYDEFRKLPKVVSMSDFHCVTGWSKFSNKWEGPQFKVLMEMAKPLGTARFATIECDNRYTTSSPLEDLVIDDVSLAYRLDDRELPPEHGGPLRIVVPHKYAYKSAKWVRKIKFTEEQELGYWESGGYSNTADPFTNDRYARLQE
jgi:DMSO/TMAO reductase YedYZ molybdopterin-dependent catalytic subunit